MTAVAQGLEDGHGANASREMNDGSTRGDLLDVLASGLADPDPDVALAAASGLAALAERDGDAHRLLGDLARGEDLDRAVEIRRLLVALASRPHRDEPIGQDPGLDAQRLEQVLRHETGDGGDAWCRAMAAEALVHRGWLEPGRLDQLARDPDPWVRRAVLSGDHARTPELVAAMLGVAVESPSCRDGSGDDDPALRRAAAHWLVTHCRRDPARIGGLARQAVPILARSGDPMLRVRACELMTALGSSRAELRIALALSADTRPMVRAAAADVLHGIDGPDAGPGAGLDVGSGETDPGGNLDERLHALLAEMAPAGRSSDPETIRVRKSAYTWLSRKFDETARNLVAEALQRGDEPEEVMCHLRALRGGLVAPGARDGDLDITAAVTASSSDGPRRPVDPRRGQARVVTRATVARRRLGRTDIEVAPLAISGAFDLPVGQLHQAYRAGVDLFFWEPRYAALTRFLRASTGRRQDLHIAAGTFHADPRSICADVDAALRKLRTDYLDIFLLFWVRSPARLSDEAHECLVRLRQQGKVRAVGFSTHDRALCARALEERDWDAVMIRHNAAHRGAETEVLPVAQARGTGVLTFSALCYGRMLRASLSSSDGFRPSAADCYRYSLSQGGVAACISAPRRYRELLHNLAVLEAPTLDPAALDALRRHGREVHDRNRDFNALVRREPLTLPAGARLASTGDAGDSSVGDLLDDYGDHIAPTPRF